MQWEQRGNIYFVFCIKTYITVLFLVHLRLFDVTAQEIKEVNVSVMHFKAKSTQHVLGLISHKAIKHTIL